MNKLRLFFFVMIGFVALYSFVKGDTKHEGGVGLQPTPTAQATPIRLTSLETCPPSEFVCMVFDINFERSETPLRSKNRVSSVVKREIDISKDLGTALVNVLGHLNGGKLQKYQVAFRHPVSELGCQDSRAAVVGASENGNGTLLTDQGRLKIVESPLYIGSRESLFIIDEKTLYGVPHLTPGWEKYTWDGGPIVKPDGRMLWRVKSTCLDLESGEEFIVVSETECRPNELKTAEGEDVLRLQTARVLDTKHLLERLRYDLRRVAGTPFFIFIYGVACT